MIFFFTFSNFFFPEIYFLIKGFVVFSFLFLNQSNNFLQNHLFFLFLFLLFEISSSIQFFSFFFFIFFFFHLIISILIYFFLFYLNLIFFFFFFIFILYYFCLQFDYIFLIGGFKDDFSNKKKFNN